MLLLQVFKRQLQLSREANELQENPTTDPDRIASFTASMLHPAIKKTAKGTYSQIARMSALDLKGSELQTNSIEIGFDSQSMKNGRAREPVAKMIYEEMFGEKILDCTSKPHPEIPFFAASPDGILESDPSILIEIKSPAPKEHQRFLRTLEIKEEYITQMIAQVACLWHEGARMVDFVQYQPSYTPQIKVVRFKPSEAAVRELEAEVQALVAELIKNDQTVEKNKHGRSEQSYPGRKRRARTKS